MPILATKIDVLPEFPPSGNQPEDMPRSRRDGPALRLVPGTGSAPGEPVDDPLSASAFDEASLIEGLVEGDHVRANELHSLLFPVVHAAIFRVTGRADAEHEDLIQLAFEQIVASLLRDQFGRTCSLKTWASLIAARVGLMAIRGRARRRKALGEPSPDAGYEALDPADVEAQVSARERLEMVRGALAELDESRSLTLVLFDAFGHSLEEVARLTGVTVAAAQSRLVRGRKELRLRLEAKGGVL